MNLRHETLSAVRHRRRPPGRPNAADARRPAGHVRHQHGPGAGPRKPVRDPGPAHRFPRHHHGREDVELCQETSVRAQPE